MDNIGTLLIVQSHAGTNAGGRNSESSKAYSSKNGKQSLSKESETTFNPYIRYPFKHFLASKQASVNRKKNEYDRSKEQRARSAAASQQRDRVKVSEGRLNGSSVPRARSAVAWRQESAAQSQRQEAGDDLIDGVQQMMLRPQDNSETSRINNNNNNFESRTNNRNEVRTSYSASAVPTYDPAVVLDESVRGSRRTETGVWGMGHARYAVPSGLRQFRHGPVDKTSPFSISTYGYDDSVQSYNRGQGHGHTSRTPDAGGQEDDMRRFTGSMSAASRTFNRRPKSGAVHTDTARWSSVSLRPAAVDDDKGLTRSAVSRQRKLPLVVELDRSSMDWWMSSADVPSQQSLEETFTARSKPLELRAMPESSRKYDGHETVRLQQQYRPPSSSRIIHKSVQEDKRTRTKSAVTFSEKLVNNDSLLNSPDGKSKYDRELLQLKDVQSEVDKCLVELHAGDRRGDNGGDNDTLVVYSYSQVDTGDTAGDVTGRIDSYEVSTTPNNENGVQTRVTGFSRSLPTSLSTLHCINVSPPPGLVYYFAFGADVNVQWLRQTIHIEPETAGWAVLYGLRLSYVEMPETGTTRVSLASDRQAAVQGLVFLLRPDELKSLDSYLTTVTKEPMRRVVLPVWLLQSDEDANEEADSTFYTEYCVPAVSYV